MSFLKKEDRSNCASYRGITLLNVSGKVFKRIILNRLKKKWMINFVTNKLAFVKKKDLVRTR